MLTSCLAPHRTNIEEPIIWTSSVAQAFDNLTQAFTSAPILVHINLEKPFIIDEDASNFALGNVLSQIAHDVELHPVAFIQENLNLQKSIMKSRTELLAIVDSFKQWCHFLEGLPHQIIVYNNHKNLKYFQNVMIIYQNSKLVVKI